MNIFEKKIDFFIQNFDTEKLLYEEGRLWVKKGWLLKNEFISICLWKSRRPKKLYNSNSSAPIKSVTGKVFAETDETEKMNLLTTLSGISVPTASAILSITNPEKYPVIDIRCVETLQDLGLINKKTINKANWIIYLGIVRDIAKRTQKTAREVEKGLFAYNRIKLDKELKNLYGLRDL